MQPFLNCRHISRVLRRARALQAEKYFCTTMSAASKDLQTTLKDTLLKLDPLDVNLYMSQSKHLWKPYHSKYVFGGQVVGQALVAATQTVAAAMNVHSLHCYFVRGGDNQKPIIYHVDRVRDGSSFCTRSVKAIQYGETILTCQVSFHKTEISNMMHQSIMPDVPQPEDLQNIEDIMFKWLNDPAIPEIGKRYLNKRLAEEIPIDIRPVHPERYFRLEKADPHLLRWIKTKGAIAEEDSNLHQCVAAYVTDLAMISTALIPHTPGFKVGMVLSLDHTLWFHSKFKLDEWMLFESQSPHAGDCRALILGRLWKRDGTLAVSVAQDGLIRPKL